MTINTQQKIKAATTAAEVRNAHVHDMESMLAARELDGFRMAEGALDPRGWNVVAEDGVIVGKVARILVQPNVNAIRYLELTLNRTATPARTLIPVGLFTELPEKQQLMLHMPANAVLATGPRLESEIITADVEARFVKAFGRGARLSEGADRYEHPMFDASALRGKPAS